MNLNKISLIRDFYFITTNKKKKRNKLFCILSNDRRFLHFPKTRSLDFRQMEMEWNRGIKIHKRFERVIHFEKVISFENF